MMTIVTEPSEWVAFCRSFSLFSGILPQNQRVRKILFNGVRPTEFVILKQEKCQNL